MGRVVLEATVTGRVVRRGDDDPVGRRRPTLVMAQDCMADRGGWGEAVISVDHDRAVVRSEHLKGGRERGFAQRVSVLGEEHRAGDALAGTVFDDRLGRRGNMRVVE